MKWKAYFRFKASSEKLRIHERTEGLTSCKIAFVVLVDCKLLVIKMRRIFDAATPLHSSNPKFKQQFSYCEKIPPDYWKMYFKIHEFP